MRASAIFSLGLWPVISAFSISSFAFPELIRHGYVNCTSCHLSATGGGVLTEYGRALSKELLSSGGVEGEEKFAYGLMNLPKEFLSGGDYRAIAIYLNSPTAEQGRIFPMQGDLQLGVQIEKFDIYGSADYYGNRNPDAPPSPIQSRRHWVNYHLSDSASIRAGKFMQAYGINTPDHYISIKQGLNWNEGSETYNIESSIIEEKYSVFLTGIFGRPDKPELDLEKGASMSTSKVFWENERLGISYLYGKNGAAERHVAGPFALLGFNPKTYLLSELDFQEKHSQSDQGFKGGLVNYQKFGYEITKGFVGYLTEEITKLDFAAADTVTFAYGLGFQWFPRPHWELNSQWQVRLSQPKNDKTDYVFAMLHFYL